MRKKHKTQVITKIDSTGNFHEILDDFVQTLNTLNIGHCNVDFNLKGKLTVTFGDEEIETRPDSEYSISALLRRSN